MPPVWPPPWLGLTGIHKLAAEQGIDPETLDDALAEALRLAYLKTPHAAKHARVELDERSGNFTVWAADEIPVEPTEDNPYPAPKLGEEYDDTPRDFGRLAAATARQVITQLFRRAEDEKVFGNVRRAPAHGEAEWLRHRPSRHARWRGRKHPAG